tara:strand:+ start:2564 stop:2893 length:330 start_codon:yes stop_codon:yes gene_type:complete
MTTSNPSEFPDDISLQTRRENMQVDDCLSLHLSKSQFGRLISYLDNLRLVVKDKTLKKNIDQLMRELIAELSPNQQAAMIRFYLDISDQDAASFLEVQKPTRSKPNETL